MRTAIAACCLLSAVCCQLMAQEEVIVDAGVNVGESEEDTQSSTNLPTLDLEAGMAESQPQPSERMGTDLRRDLSPVRDGHDGTPGQNGRDGMPGRSGRSGRNGRDGRDGRHGRDADPRVVTKMVLVELEKTQRGETPAEWAKPYLDALKAEKLVVGYPDGTIRPKEKTDFERVVTVIGRVQRQLRSEIMAAEQRAKMYTDQKVGNEREQRISADAKKRKDRGNMIVGIVGGMLGTLFVLLVVALLFRQPIVAAIARPTVAPPAAPATPPAALLNGAQRDATHVGAVRGAGFIPNWRQVGRREGILVEPLASGGVFVETFEAEGDERERFVSPGSGAGGSAVALAVSGVPTSTGTDAPTKECVIETKSPEVTAAITDATTVEKPKTEPAEAETEEV